MPRNRRRRAVVLVVVSALAGAGACRGDDRLSRADYADAATAICLRAGRDIAALPAADPVAPDAAAETVGRALEIQRRALAELRALRPPPADQGAVDGWLDLVGQSLRHAQTAHDALEGHDVDGVARANAAGATADADAGVAARQLGLAECGHGP